MAPRPTGQTEYLRVRWRIYLSSVLETRSPSRAKLADALDVPTSRVSQWIAGERGVEPQTAFAVGETLCSRFALATSGAEALFAAGYFADVLHLLRNVGLIESADARRIAVALACRLPGRFLTRDVAALDEYPNAIAGNDQTDEFDRYEARRLRQDVKDESDRFAAIGSIATESDMLLSGAAARDMMVTAWELTQRPLTGILRVRPPGLPLAAYVVPALAAVLANRPILETILDADIEPVPAKVAAATIEVIIALARALEGRNPTTSSPRLWRMLSEWAFALDPRSFARFAALLPPTYTHFALLALPSEDASSAASTRY